MAFLPPTDVVISPQSLPLASSPASHFSSATNTVSYFRVNDPEEDVQGDSQSRNERSVSCSRNMKASTSVHTDISFRSPVSIVSVDSQPNLSSFNDSNITDYCINNLFNNIYSPLDRTTGEQVSSTVSTQNSSLKRKFSSTSLVSGYVISEVASPLNLMKLLKYFWQIMSMLLCWLRLGSTGVYMTIYSNPHPRLPCLQERPQ